MVKTDTAEINYLDTRQLNALGKSFREWMEASHRKDVRLSRRRILLIFLTIRYTGAKLNETLSLNPLRDIDPNAGLVRFHDGNGQGNSRDVHISESLAEEFRAALSDTEFLEFSESRFDIDPAFVRRKFYERAKACGFDKRMGSPEMLRKARAVELMHGNLPLPAVQLMLGQSTVSHAVSRAPFSPEELREVTRLYMDRESDRRTSARNAFYGKVSTIDRGDIQARVEILTADGHKVSTLITINSLERMFLTPGKLVTAEVKAPYVMLQWGNNVSSSAENVFSGSIISIKKGDISTEYIVSISDAAELCSLTSSISAEKLDLHEGDPVQAIFNCYSVVLHI
ncbi:TOBE domain-containing protein [Pseudodesulfovibrio sp.]|uniref:TOBE domain-containing protein n=1 Tax=unclassified Pseudodesulfovibrio TaxID=2661612 RepID=UPI003B00FF14